MIVDDRGRSCEKNQSQELLKISELGFQVAERFYMVVPPVFHDRVSGHD